MGFWKGAIIGGMAGAAYGIWTAPRPGDETRESLVDTIEARLFQLTGMEVWSPQEETPTQPAYEWLAADPEREFGTTSSPS